MSPGKRERQHANMVAKYKKMGRREAARYRKEMQFFQNDEEQLEKLNREGHGNCREAMRLYLRIQENGK